MFRVALKYFSNQLFENYSKLTWVIICELELGGAPCAIFKGEMDVSGNTEGITC